MQATQPAISPENKKRSSARFKIIALFFLPFPRRKSLSKSSISFFFSCARSRNVGIGEFCFSFHKGRREGTPPNFGLLKISRIHDLPKTNKEEKTSLCDIRRYFSFPVFLVSRGEMKEKIFYFLSDLLCETRS